MKPANEVINVWPNFSEAMIRGLLPVGNFNKPWETSNFQLHCELQSFIKQRQIEKRRKALTIIGDENGPIYPSR